VTRVALLALVTLVLVPASAGAGTTRPPLGLTANPAHVALSGSGRAAVRVTNPGVGAVVVDVGRAGFALDLRGQPKIVARSAARAATTWLTVLPRRFVLRSGATRLLAVSARIPRRVEPGDHDALVLLTTRPRRSAGVAVRMRLGIVVVVRAPGRVVRRLAVRGLTVRRAGGRHILELRVANRGNVTETLGAGQVRITLRRGETRVRLRTAARELRPASSGLLSLDYRGRLRGWVTVGAEVTADGLPAVRRTFRVRL
jgi:hypothetical protein